MACKVVERTCIYGNKVKRDREKWVSSFLLHFHLDPERKISKLIRGSDELAVGTWKNTEEKETRHALPALPLHFMPLRLRFNNCFSKQRKGGKPPYGSTALTSDSRQTKITP